MIAGCIDRIRRDGCGGCVRRNACEDLFSGLFAPGGMFAAPRSGAREPERPERSADWQKPLLAFLGRVAKAMEVRPPPAASRFRRDVETQIERLLPSGEVGMERVARELGLSRQTLYRRLKAEDATFEQLLDGVRRRLALRYLREEGMAVKEAAWRLGFSDPAAFSRAFKRWTGSSPTRG